MLFTPRTQVPVEATRRASCHGRLPASPHVVRVFYDFARHPLQSLSPQQPRRLPFPARACPGFPCEIVNPTGTHLRNVPVIAVQDAATRLSSPGPCVRGGLQACDGSAADDRQSRPIRTLWGSAFATRIRVRQTSDACRRDSNRGVAINPVIAPPMLRCRGNEVTNRD